MSLQQEILNITSNIDELKQCEYTIKNIFNNCTNNNENIFIKEKDSSYVIYKLASFNNHKHIISKYKTADKREATYIILKYLVNDAVWDEVVARYSDGAYVEYTIEAEEFEDSLTKQIINKLPQYCKDYFNSNYNITDKYESFTDTEFYKQWIDS